MIKCQTCNRFIEDAAGTICGFCFNKNPEEKKRSRKNCECQKEENGCAQPSPNRQILQCSRNPDHKGKHFACGRDHKIDEWER